MNQYTRKQTLGYMAVSLFNAQAKKDVITGVLLDAGSRLQEDTQVFPFDIRDIFQAVLFDLGATEIDRDNFLSALHYSLETFTPAEADTALEAFAFILQMPHLETGDKAEEGALYVLLDLERTMQIGKSVFWKPARRGYTPHLEEAGLYSQKEAYSLVLDDVEKKTVAVPQQSAVHLGA